MFDVPFPLLRTKLLRPLPAPSLVPRQRLVDKLSERPDAALTLIVASAGAGKTSLVTQWLGHSSWLVAWLALDETDNKLAVFLSYLIAAIDTIHPAACANTERLLHAPQLPPADYLIDTLANQLNGVTRPFVLVLDDYHHLCDTAIHHLIGQLLCHAPPARRLVITSRFDPPLPVSRFASRGTPVEIRAKLSSRREDCRTGRAVCRSYFAIAGMRPSTIRRCAAISPEKTCGSTRTAHTPSICRPAIPAIPTGFRWAAHMKGCSRIAICWPIPTPSRMCRSSN
jgi:hypothetical protein